MENFHRLLQLLADRRYHWRENIHNAWWPKSWPAVYGADTESHASDGCAGYGCVAVRPLNLISTLNSECAITHVFPGLLCDLLWSDPDKDITGWSENDRGVSFTFGPDVVSRFLQKHDMDLICRAHQVCKVAMACITLPRSLRFCSTGTDCSCLLGCRRRIWVLCQETFGDIVLCTKLLWRVWQRGCDDECGRDIIVLVPGKLTGAWLRNFLPDPFVRRYWNRQRKRQSIPTAGWM